MQKTILALLVSSPLLLAAPVAAQSTPHAGVAFTLSDLGAGVDVAVPVGKKLNIRGGFSALGLNHTFEDDGIELAADLKLRSVSAHLDIFPFGGGFHLSPGLMLRNNNEVTAVASVAAGKTFDLGDGTFVSSPSRPVTGSAAITFARKVAPSLRMGWGNVVPRGGKRWSVPFELGVVFTEAPTAALSLQGTACDTSGAVCRDVATDATLQSEVRKQETKINDKIDVLKMLPVLSIGVAFRF